VYKANWIDGHLSHWDDKKQNWKRHNPNMLVIMKIINSKNISLKFLNEVLYIFIYVYYFIEIDFC
jgi:hypothetical protein